MILDMTALIGLKRFQTKQADKSHSLNNIAGNPQKDYGAFSRVSTAMQAVQTSSLMISARLLKSTAGLSKRWDGTARLTVVISKNGV